MDRFERDIIQLVRQYSVLSMRSEVEERKPMEKEAKSSEFWRSVIAEFLATFLFVILLCGSAVPWPDYTPDFVTVSICGGIAIASLVQCFGHISGGHINPAVSCAMFVTRKISPLRFVAYVLAQCGGACCGAAFLYGVTAEGHRGNLGATLVNESITPWQGFGIELLLTFCLVFTVFATVDPQRKELGSSSLAIGVAVLVAHLMGISYTGSGINPARSLGPVVIMRTWKHHWVYWVGPLIGGSLAGLLYEHIFDPSEKVSGLKEALEADDDHYGKPNLPDTDKHLHQHRPHDRHNFTSNGKHKSSEAGRQEKRHEAQSSYSHNNVNTNQGIINTAFTPSTTNIAEETRF